MRLNWAGLWQGDEPGTPTWSGPFAASIEEARAAWEAAARWYTITVVNRATGERADVQVRATCFVEAQQRALIQTFHERKWRNLAALPETALEVAA
jgi:hypothetical protein